MLTSVVVLSFIGNFKLLDEKNINLKAEVPGMAKVTLSF